MTGADRLGELGLTVPAPAPPKGAYLPSRRCGDLLWVSGAAIGVASLPGGACVELDLVVSLAEAGS